LFGILRWDPERAILCLDAVELIFFTTQDLGFQIGDFSHAMEGVGDPISNVKYLPIIGCHVSTPFVRVAYLDFRLGGEGWSTALYNYAIRTLKGTYRTRRMLYQRCDQARPAGAGNGVA
jgi:hypothetical protein